MSTGSENIRYFSQQEQSGQPRAGSAGNDARVLVIAHAYPPATTGEACRTGKYTRLLPGFGWRTTVLTIGDEEVAERDYALLEENFQAGVHVERVSQPKMFGKGKPARPAGSGAGFGSVLRQAAFQVDGAAGWQKPALVRAADIIARGDAAVVLAAGPPFTDAMIAVELNRVFGLPLVLDYRDLWVNGAGTFYPTPLHKSRAEKDEETALKTAETVIVANRKLKERLIKRYPFLSHESVYIIPDGFDGAEIRNAMRVHQAGHAQAGVFALGVDAAMFNGKSGKDLGKFFRAIAEMMAQNPVMQDSFRLYVIGSAMERLEKPAREAGVFGVLHLLQITQAPEFTHALFYCDALLGICDEEYRIPYAMYQYIGSRRPVLGVAGDTTLLRQTFGGYGSIVFREWGKPEEVAGGILELYNAWSEGRVRGADEEFVRGLDQRKLGEQISRILAYSLRI